MANVLNVILKTIEDVQTKNRKNPNIKTADPSVFDLLRRKIGEIDGKVKNNQTQNGRSNPKSILEMIKDGIEGVRKDNRADKKVPTADKSVFDDLFKRLDQNPKRQATTGIKRVIQDYNLDVSRIPATMLRDIQSKYQGDCQNLNKQYAQAIHNISKQVR